MRHPGASLVILAAMAIPAPAALAVVQPVVARFDGGPSVPVGYGFAAGESIFLSFDIDGFKPEGDEDLKLNLSWECQAFDNAGVALTALRKGAVRVDLAPEDKKWRPRVRVELVMPQSLLSAPAEIRLAAEDHVAKTKASLTVPIRTLGLNLEGVSQLQALRYRFLRSEDAPEALTVPAYRPADTVWAKFEFAGYKMGEANAYDVSYGLEVFRANGESLFRQDEAAHETGKSFYPRRYLTGTISLQLTKDLALGEYTIVLRIRDAIGNQESESKHLFRVE